MKKDFRRGNKIVLIDNIAYETQGSVKIARKGQKAIIIWSYPSLSSATIRITDGSDVGKEFKNVNYSQFEKEG